LPPALSATLARQLGVLSEFARKPILSEHKNFPRHNTASMINCQYVILITLLPALSPTISGKTEFGKIAGLQAFPKVLRRNTP
jgi:hypothetical protein